MNKFRVTVRISSVILLFLLYLGCDRRYEERNDAGPWSRSNPEAQNMDGDLLSGMVDAVDGGHFGSVHSILIIRNDHLVLEEYFRGYHSGERHALYSVTKSFTSCLIGQALEQGHIDSLSKKLLNFFPEYPRDSLKENITLNHILSMSAGIQWNELSMTYEEPQNDLFGLAYSSDWIQYMLSRPMEYPPGTQFVYNSGCSVLLSGVIKKTTGVTAEEFAAKNLFNRIGITDWSWDSGPNGITNTGWGLSLRPIDMARLGYLYLNNGQWDTVAVVKENWVSLSTSDKISAGMYFRYAYQWWRFSNDHPVASVLSTNDVYFAWGYGGQFIFVIPHLSMVVAFTAGNFIGGSDGYAFTLLKDYIVPAVKN